MFSPELKEEISQKIQKLLSETNHPELPPGEIHFLLHIDGAKKWSWANIRNKSSRSIDAPDELIRNLRLRNY